MIDFRIELPKLRSPIALIIDDPAPYVNHLYWLRKELNPNHPEFFSEFKTIPNDFLDDFIELVKAEQVKGKFSVIPNPSGQGFIDEGIKDYPKEGVEEWLEKVKNYIMPLFDITPEMLTHTRALNLETGELLPMHEQKWASQQNAETLTKYIAKALDTLRKVGIDAPGVTSPGAFGSEVEGEYARAVLEAERLVHGRTMTWYFLKVDPRSKMVMPRIVYLDRFRAEYVVSIVSANDDIIWQTMNPENRANWTSDKASTYADYYITSDGKAGRLVELVEAGSYVVWHTHWNSLWSNDARNGLKVLKEVLKRINTLIKEKIIWMKLSEIALYYAASKVHELHICEEKDYIRFLLETPFPCPDLTISLNLPGRAKRLFLSKAQIKGDELRVSQPSVLDLREVGDRTHLESNTWFQRGERLYLCFDRRSGNCIEIQLER